MVLVRLYPLLLALTLATASFTQAAITPSQPVVTGDVATYDARTKENILTGHARITYGDTLLTADELRYNANTNLVFAKGHFVLTQGRRRLVAEEGSFDLSTQSLKVQNLRLGEFPLYLSGDTVEGTLDNLVFTNATVFFRENATYTPSIHARRLSYVRGKIVSAEGLRLGFLGGHFISVPRFEQALDADFISYVSGRLGYRGNLGVFAELGLHIPIAPGWQAGADLGFYGARGVMAGPSAQYSKTTPNQNLKGSIRSGYINDSGDRRTDILGHPVPRDRSYLEWQHQQQIGDHWNIAGEFNYWSDSEVVRDFRHRLFDITQQPDSFLEAVYTQNNYLLSSFARFHPNSFHQLQERLPEVRYDLMPTALPLGFYERAEASAAVLQDDAFGLAPAQRTNRLDAFYGIERPFVLTPWLSVTPVAGARATYYTDATGGKDTYTRTLSEIGFDARLLSSGTFDYKNPLWEIDGLRHLVAPTISYRYAPRAGYGKPYIPTIDRRVFTTYLEPLSIADSRHIDDLGELNTARLQLGNTLQTRDATYGSRDLATLNFAADYRFEHQIGQRRLSDLYTEFALTPASWVRWELFQRLNPHKPDQDELNTALSIVDQEWWSARLATHFLKGNYEEYLLEYRQRLNESYDVVGVWRYDAINHRLNEQSYGVWQRLGQTWSVKYEISFHDGPRRESSVSLDLEIQLLKF